VYGGVLVGLALQGQAWVMPWDATMIAADLVHHSFEFEW